MLVSTTDQPRVANCQQCGNFIGEGTVHVQHARMDAWYCASCARALGYTR